MRQLASKIKPASGFSYVVHLALLALLPILVFVFVRVDFAQLSLALIILSKWRMFAVRPRHWPANIRANAVDIIVGIALLAFMTHTVSAAWQLVWMMAYIIWLIFMKPMTGALAVSAQAFTGQLLGLMALYLAWGDLSLAVLTFGTGLVCYMSARHFLTSFDEPLAGFMAYLWGYFGAALAWVLGHWLLFYGSLAQPTLMLTVVGYGLATLYYLEHNDRLSTLLKRQFIFIMIAIIVIVLAFSDWGDKTV